MTPAYGLGNPITPIKKGPATFIQTHAQAIILPNNMAPLVDQEIIAQEGHLVTCYQEHGKLKANVEMNAPQGFSKTYQGAEVLLEQGADVSRLPSLELQVQQRRIPFQLGQGGNPARIIIYKDTGLMGGMRIGDEEAEAREDELISIIERYTGAADRAHVATQFILGMIYEHGKGVAKDYGRARAWYRIAANQGHAKAQFNLAWMYVHAQGIRQNYAKAVSWYAKAANQGNVSAQFNLGVMYYHGKGVSQDYSSAREWFERAAEQGNAEAQTKILEINKILKT